MTDLCISLKISLHLEPMSTLRDLSMPTLQPPSTSMITLYWLMLPSKRSILQCFLFIFLAMILEPRTAYLDGTHYLLPMVNYPCIHPVAPHLVMLCEDGNIPKRLHILRFTHWLGLCLGVPRGDLVNQLKVS